MWGYSLVFTGNLRRVRVFEESLNFISENPKVGTNLSYY